MTVRKVQMKHAFETGHGIWLRLRLHSDVLTWRQGWIWPLGATSVLSAVLLAAWMWIDLQAAQAALVYRERQVAAHAGQLNKERQSTLDAGGMRDAEQSAEARLTARRERLGAVLRDADDTMVQLRQLYQLADRLQIAIHQADFQQMTGSGGVGRLQFSMPIRGSYSQLRNFVEQSLRELPNLSVDRLQFRRNQVGQVQLDASLHVSLWLHERSLRPIRPNSSPLQ